MKLTNIQKWLLSANILIILSFGGYFLSNLNFEFLAYVGLVILIVAILFGTLNKTKFSNGIVFGITLWALLHMLGGSLMTSDGVLYAYKIIPIFDGGADFYILKMDQLVHAALYAVVGLIFFHLIRNFIGLKTNVGLVAVISIFAAAGFSILNEIIEFLAVIILPETGVGGYHNTVLDLIFNLLGATVAVVFKVIAVKRQETKSKN
jgi:uncharacterized membrane protein YjdF